MKKETFNWLSRKTIMPILGPAFMILGFYEILNDLGWDGGPPLIPYMLTVILLVWNSVETIKDYRAQKKTLNS